MAPDTPEQQHFLLHALQNPKRLRIPGVQAQERKQQGIYRDYVVKILRPLTHLDDHRWAYAGLLEKIPRTAFLTNQFRMIRASS